MLEEDKKVIIRFPAVTVIRLFSQAAL